MIDPVERSEQIILRLEARLAACEEQIKADGRVNAEQTNNNLVLTRRLAEAEECLRRCRAYGDGPAELVRIYFDAEKPTSIRATMDGE